MSKCNIVQDLIPLVLEEIASKDSNRFVLDHINECPSCQKSYLDLQKDKVKITNKSEVPLHSVRKEIERKRWKSAIFATLSLLLLGVIILNYLTIPESFNYSPDLFTVSEANGEVKITLNRVGKIHGLTKQKDENGDIEYSFYATKNHLSRFQEEYPSIVIQDTHARVYYIADNNYDQMIYGENSKYEGRKTLPRLALNFYFGLAGIVALGVFIVMVVFRRKKAVRETLISIFLAPISFLVSVVFIKGLDLKSSFLIRDLLFILSSSLVLYIILLIIRNSLQKRYDDRKLLKDLEQ